MQWLGNISLLNLFTMTESIVQIVRIFYWDKNVTSEWIPTKGTFIQLTVTKSAQKMFTMQFDQNL